MEIWIYDIWNLKGWQHIIISSNPLHPDDHKTSNTIHLADREKDKPVGNVCKHDWRWEITVWIVILFSCWTITNVYKISESTLTSNRKPGTRRNCIN